MTYGMPPADYRAYPELFEFLRRLRGAFDDRQFKQGSLKVSYGVVTASFPGHNMASPGTFSLNNDKILGDISRLRAAEPLLFRRGAQESLDAWLVHLANRLNLNLDRCKGQCPGGPGHAPERCRCYDDLACEFEAPFEPTQLDLYNQALEADRERAQSKLDTGLENQRKLNASIRHQRARLNSVDDFPKNCRLILVNSDGSNVLANLIKDKDGVWFLSGRMATWLNVYDTLTDPPGEGVELIQVRPAKTIPVGKDFKGYGAPVPAKKTAAKKPAAKRLAAKRPAIKRVAKKVV